MQIAYRGRNVDDARSARDVLAAAGIPAHIPDSPAISGGEDQLEVVHVLVDNRSLGPARRALARWLEEKDRDDNPQAD